MKSHQNRGTPIPYIMVALLCAVLSLSLLGCLSGCTDPSSPYDAAQNNATGGAGSQGTSQTEGRRFTIPKEYFEDKTQAEAIETIQQEGGTDTAYNSDGSVTTTMSNAAFTAFVTKLKSQTQKALDAIPQLPSYKDIKNVSYNDAFTQVTMTTQHTASEDSDKKAADYAIYLVCLYQTIAGNNLSCEVDIVDPAGNSLAHYTYPQS